MSEKAQTTDWLEEICYKWFKNIYIYFVDKSDPRYCGYGRFNHDDKVIHISNGQGLIMEIPIYCVQMIQATPLARDGLPTIIAIRTKSPH